MLWTPYRRALEINVGRRGRRAVNFSLGFSSWHAVSILNHFHTLSSAWEIPPRGGFPISWFGLSHNGKHSRKMLKRSLAESFDAQLRRQRKHGDERCWSQWCLWYVASKNQKGSMAVVCVLGLSLSSDSPCYHLQLSRTSKGPIVCFSFRRDRG